MTDRPGSPGVGGGGAARPAGPVTVRLPGRLAGRGRDVLTGKLPPAAPRDAATVMLLRPAPGTAALQVYLLRRPTSMAFAPGACVFPGGSVDDRDAHADVGWAGPTADDWGRLLGAPPGLARALVCAAVRETFEESGVLLAGTAAGTVVPGTSGAGWEDDRRALLARSVSLAELLRRRGLVLRSDLLSPWARWITPVTEERRYDTRFFTAALPAGQRARHLGGEAVEAAWVEPAAALAAAARREIALLPPTAVTLAQLRDCGGVSRALEPRPVSPLMPEVRVEGEEVWLVLPVGLEHPW